MFIIEKQMLASWKCVDPLLWVHKMLTEHIDPLDCLATRYKHIQGWYASNGKCRENISKACLMTLNSHCAVERTIDQQKKKKKKKEKQTRKKTWRFPLKTPGRAWFKDFNMCMCPLSKEQSFPEPEQEMFLWALVFDFTRTDLFWFSLRSRFLASPFLRQRERKAHSECVFCCAQRWIMVGTVSGWKFIFIFIPPLLFTSSHICD